MLLIVPIPFIPSPRFSTNGQYIRLSLIVTRRCLHRVPIPKLLELFSELTWRIVGGTLPPETAIKYLASDAPFEKRLLCCATTGDEKGKLEQTTNSKTKLGSVPATSAGDGDGDGDVADGKAEGEKLAREGVALVVECLCDTLWGVDSMVRGTISKDNLDRLAENREWGRLCSFVSQLRETNLVRDNVLLSLLPVGFWALGAFT